MVNTEEVISAAPRILPQLPHCWQYVQVDLEFAKHKVSSIVVLRRQNDRQEKKFKFIFAPLIFLRMILKHKG